MESAGRPESRDRAVAGRPGSAGRSRELRGSAGHFPEAEEERRDRWAAEGEEGGREAAGRRAGR